MIYSIDDQWDSFGFMQVDVTDTVPGTKKVQTYQANGESTEWVPYMMLFRAPSEHTFEGRHMDIELQFVHRHPEDFNVQTDLDGRGLHGKGMILSVFFDRLHGGNEDNAFIESLAWDK